MLDLGPGVGALVLHTGADLHGKEIEISPVGRDERALAQAGPRAAGRRPAALRRGVRRLPAGEYTLWLDDRPLRRNVAVADAAVTDISLKEEHA